MSLKYTSYKKSIMAALAQSLGIYILWIFMCFDVQAQTIEIKTEEIKLAEGLIVRSEDIDKARIKAEEVKAHADKSMSEIESFISNLESDAETTDVYLEGLQREKKAYQAGTTNPEFLEVLDKELGVIKQKIDVDNEHIQAYKDQITALQNQAKVYADWVMLLCSAVKLAETIAVTPSDQFSTAKKEADIAQGYITAVQANLKEKETLVSHFTKELEDVNLKRQRSVMMK